MRGSTGDIRVVYTSQLDLFSGSQGSTVQGYTHTGHLVRSEKKSGSECDALTNLVSGYWKTR